MSLIHSLLSSFRQSPSTIPDEGKKTELEEFDQRMGEKLIEARAERDRTARIAAYLKCTQEGGTDCRIDISWEELAAGGLDGRP